MLKEDGIVSENIAALDVQIIREQKVRMRHEIAARRNDIAELGPYYMDAAEGVMRQILNHFPLEKEAVVSGYWPTGSELDLRPTMSFLAKTHKCCLPIIDPVTDKLIFSLWNPDAEMVQGAFNIMEPEDLKPIRPDVCLMPLIAFDREGRRLGYGGSYYDGYLSENSVLKVGIAYCEQEVDRVPVEEHDHKMDWVVTPKEIIFCGEKSQIENSA